MTKYLVACVLTRREMTHFVLRVVQQERHAIELVGLAQTADRALEQFRE